MVAVVEIAEAVEHAGNSLVVVEIVAAEIVAAEIVAAEIVAVEIVAVEIAVVVQVQPAAAFDVH